jgi:alpha/beta superfamily hydrolase
VTDDIDPTAVPTRAHLLRTVDGIALEAETRLPARPVGAAVLAHPHPEHGGSMRSLVTSELFRTLPERDVAVIRFNFRGVERSEGSYDAGHGEQRDVLAAIDALAEQAPEVPLVLAGWSFGADVSLSIVDPRVAGWCVVAPPLRILRADELLAAADPRPKRLVVPENDQFRTPDSVRAFTEGWTATDVVVIAGGDHFLAGRTDQVAVQIADFLGSLPPSG